MPSNPPPTKEQLRRQCLRGMLELDLLLEAFLDNEYEGLADIEKQAFVELLATHDTELLDSILADGLEHNSESAAVMARLRKVILRPPITGQI